MNLETDAYKSFVLDANLSTRTTNILLRDGFDSISSIVDFYLKHGDFFSLYGCGVKSNLELTKLAESLNYKVNNYEIDQVLTDVANNYDYERLFVIQFKIILKKSSTNLQNYVRSRIGYNYTFKDIIELFESYQDVDNSIINELLKLKSDYKKKIYELNKLNNFIEIEKKIFKTIFSEISIAEKELDTLFIQIKSEYDYYPVFRIIEFIIESSNFFRKNEAIIFKNYLKYYNSNTQTYTLEEIGNELNLTRERVRQIRHKILKVFDVKFYFISHLSLFVDFYKVYGIESNDCFIYLDDHIVKKINEVEQTNFSKLFMSKVFAEISDGTFSLCGFELNYHTLHQNKEHPSLREPYLVSHDIANYFDFEGFVTDLRNRQQEAIKDPYRLNLRAYISRFCEDLNLNKIIKLEGLCRKIVTNEFEIIVDFKGELVFERNKKKQSYELALEALEKLGANENGYHIIQISEKITDLYPEIDYLTNLDSLRTAMNNHKSIFIYFGRSSSYGLKSWENYFENVRGGTIRDLVFEFLVDKNSPQHVSMILEFVNKYRNTNESNIIANLKLDRSNTFKIYEGKFVGLLKKKYSDKDIDFSSAHFSVFTGQNLKKILPDNFDNVVQKICLKYNLKEIQVSSILKKQLSNGQLYINNENVLSIYDE